MSGASNVSQVECINLTALKAKSTRPDAAFESVFPYSLRYLFAFFPSIEFVKKEDASTGKRNLIKTFSTRAICCSTLFHMLVSVLRSGLGESWAETSSFIQLNQLYLLYSFNYIYSNANDCFLSTASEFHSRSKQ
jgi:hypothetical protein